MTLNSRDRSDCKSTTEAKIVIEIPDIDRLAAVVEKLSIAVSKLDMLIAAAGHPKPETPELLTTSKRQNSSAFGLTHLPFGAVMATTLCNGSRWGD